VAALAHLEWHCQKARKSIDRIRAVMSHFRGEAGGRKGIAPLRKLSTALHALDGYLTGQSAWLANYAERHRAGSRWNRAHRRNGQYPSKPPNE
jgi:hypothetical protein